MYTAKRKKREKGGNDRAVIVAYPAGRLKKSFLFTVCKWERQQEERMKQDDPHGDSHRPFPSQHASGWFQNSIKSMEQTPGDRPQHQGKWKNRWKHQQTHLHLPELLDLLLAVCSLHTRERVHTQICGRQGVGRLQRTFFCLQDVSAWPGWCRVSGSSGRHVPVGLHRPPI